MNDTTEFNSGEIIDLRLENAFLKGRIHELENQIKNLINPPQIPWPISPQIPSYPTWPIYPTLY